MDAGANMWQMRGNVVTRKIERSNSANKLLKMYETKAELE